MAEGYAISERDYQRIQATILKVERMADVNFRRRMPVGGWSPGGAGMPLPDDRIEIDDATPSQLVEATHENMWLWIPNASAVWPGHALTADKELILPPSPKVRHLYRFLCISSGDFRVRIYPGAGQTITMPAFYVAPSGVVCPDGSATPYRYIDLDVAGLSQIVCVVTLICTAANTWIAWEATHTSVGP